MRTLATGAVLAALAVPTTAALARDGDDKPRAQRAGAVAACQAERTADNAAFTAKYANKKGKRAMRRCVRAHVRQARKACRAERKADKPAFRAKYAEDGKHARRNCVRRHAGDPIS